MFVLKRLLAAAFMCFSPQSVAWLWLSYHIAEISEELRWLLSFQEESPCKKLKSVVVPEWSARLLSADDRV